ncbi:gamma-glutamylcyclotransferase 2-3 isoform X1 [Zingiber officinale]|uniref:gamma-glutamylcyclotransferase 2-3 isoform X1 n=1 Tax=Zingiber officinale TaxID=94328 RepID=UPI001C4CFA30|nr:gamma-glutamylcyclotransferase 2-3 isoform X1 [Zingiber officinale]
MAATWVFGYGSLIWKAGFHYDERRVGFVRGFRRVFYQGSTDHRGTPDFPGRTVTLEPLTEATCWGVAYRIPEEEKKIALESLEIREKQYDLKVYLDFYTDEASSIPAINGVMVYIGSEDKKTNPNYLGPASLDEMARQIAVAEGPSGPNTDYLFHLEESLKQIGCEDPHVTDLVAAVRRVVSTKEGA